MTVEVLIPYGRDQPDRRRALEWVRRRWAQFHPDWPVIVGESLEEPWSKARAVDVAFARSTASTVIVADADVWVDDLDPFVDMVETRVRLWATPHNRVWRFNEAGTKLIVDGDEPTTVALAPTLHLDSKPYAAMTGGGMVIVDRELYAVCPIPHMGGWGGEDEAFGYALFTVGGRRGKGLQPIWHLWHPPQERMNRKVGNVTNDTLRARYKAAGGDLERMLALIAENRRSM